MLYRAPVESMLEKFTYSKFKRLSVTLSRTYGLIHPSSLVWSQIWPGQINLTLIPTHIWGKYRWCSMSELRSNNFRTDRKYPIRVCILLSRISVTLTDFGCPKFKPFLDQSWSNKLQVFPFFSSTVNLDMRYPFEWIRSEKSCQHHEINHVPKVVNKVTFLARFMVPSGLFRSNFNVLIWTYCDELLLHWY